MILLEGKFVIALLYLVCHWWWWKKRSLRLPRSRRRRQQREAAEIFLFINFPRINFTWAQVKYLFRVINEKLKKLFRLTIHSSWASRQWGEAIPEKIGFALRAADDGSGNRITQVYHWKSSNWTTAFTHKKVSETRRVGGNSIPLSNIHRRDAKSGFPILNVKM